MEYHPIACIFPMMDEKAFEELKADITANGVEQSGLLYEGKILDGRNRYRACCEIGIEMGWQEVELDDPEEAAKFDPLKYVLSQNLHRRHLKQSQRAVIAAKMATLKRGQSKGNTSKDVFDQGDAATLLSVSLPTVQRAKHVLEHGCKQLIEAVESCEITVSMADKLCKAEPDKREQAKLVKDGKQAIKEFLNPSPHEGRSIDSDEDFADDPDGIGDQFDEPVVRSFKVADYRLNTLRKIIATLQPHERSVLADWLSEEHVQA